MPSSTTSVYGVWGDTPFGKAICYSPTTLGEKSGAELLCFQHVLWSNKLYEIIQAYGEDTQILHFRMPKSDVVLSNREVHLDIIVDIEMITDFSGLIYRNMQLSRKKKVSVYIDNVLLVEYEQG